jgi:hypothetical protein
MTTTQNTPHIISEDLAANYPLTKEELLLLAEHWFGQHLERCVSCTLHGRTSAADERIQAYASERLDLIDGILRKDLVDAACERVEARCRRDLGEELWTLFLVGYPAWRVQDAADEVNAELDTPTGSTSDSNGGR